MTRPLTSAQRAARKRAKPASRRVAAAVNLSDYPHRLEFVCDRCLFAVMSNDDAPWPRCPRGHGRLTPNSDEVWIRPQTLQRQETLRKKAAAASPQAATAAAKGKPTHQRRRAEADAA